MSGAGDDGVVSTVRVGDAQVSGPATDVAAREPVPFQVTGPLPPDRATTLLEASAGTGKTWTIAALVARMVAEGECRLDQMLVVTFGRAASQELRDRVRTRLVALDRALSAAVRGRPPAALDVLEQALLDAPSEELAVRGRRVREALASFDAATIATTHQFCQLVLKSLGVAGDTDSSATLVEDLDDLVREVVDDLYVRVFSKQQQDPEFSRKDALAIARAAVGDPAARLEPADAAPGTRAHRRRGFAAAVRKELDVRKRRLGILSYDDLLSQLAEALEDDDAPARQRMRSQWSVVLVDEFQDTDPVQWQVLDRAFTGHARMVLIGDPKQAIYAFRGGDVDTYQLARAQVSEHATLDRNFRTDGPLLRQLQTMIGAAELGRGITVRPVTAHHEESRLVGAHRTASLRLRQVDRSRFPSKGKWGPPIAELRRHVALDLAADVRELLGSGATLDGEPLRAGDVAVLCPRHVQVTEVRRALHAAGIPAVVAAGGSVFASEGAEHWLTLLEAMERPHLAGRVRAAALTPFFGRTARDLDVEADAVTDAVAEVLRDWAVLLRSRGVAAVLEAAGPALTGRVLGTVGGERLMTDVRHVAEVLHEHAAGERPGPLALVTWMREQMADGARVASDERTRRLDSDAAAVQVLTVHTSKGLEFGVVYAPSLADAHHGEPDFPRFHDEQQQRCLDVGGTPFSRDTLRRAAQEELEEELRLLYVAVTRAKSQLVLWWLPSERNTPASPLHRLLFGRAPHEAEVPASAPMVSDEDARRRLERWQGIGALSLETADPADAEAPAPAGVPPELRVRRWDRRLDDVWRRTSYTSLSAAAEAEIAARQEPLVASEPEDPPLGDEQEVVLDQRTVPVLADDVVSPMAGMPAGATFGSLVHEVLEHADPQAPEHGGDLLAELLARIAESLPRWPVDLGKEGPEGLAAALVAVCDSPLGPLVPTTLRQVPLRDRLREMDFELPLHGGDGAPVGTGRAPDPTLADLAPILRRHLPDDDPLRPYADVVDDPAYRAQALRGYLTGSVDVVLRLGDRYLVVDYKTNWLGAVDEPLTAAAYAPQQLAAAMTHSSYPLQALLYAVVLHRFLRWRLRGYDPARHLGGVLYLYVRGMCGSETPLVDGEPCGVFSWQPPPALVADVSDLLDGRVAA